MPEADRAVIQKAALQYNIYRCYSCGKCTSVCPLGRLNTTFGPRRIVTRLSDSGMRDLLDEEGLWRCLSCRICTECCPSSVEFPDFVQRARVEMSRQGAGAPCSHGGALQSWMKLMTRSDLKQTRTGWISDDLRVSRTGDLVYFVGCLPHFDAFFPELGVHSINIAGHTVRILNTLGVEPVILQDERCCGHDLLWQGDEKAFEELARLNLEQIRTCGASTVLMSCSECARTFRLDYQRLIGRLPFKVIHLAEFLAEQVDRGRLSFRHTPEVVTFQDPCRLGRHLGVYDQPRKVITSIPGVELREMPESRENSVCCGTSCWMACGADSRRIQDERLSNAAQVGATRLITACPKCAIHYTCSRYTDAKLEDRGPVVEDLAVFVSEALQRQETSSQTAALTAGSN